MEQLDRSIVDVQIELDSRAEQDVARVSVVRHAWIAERSDEDGVEIVPQHRVTVRRDRDSRLEIVIGAPPQHLEVEPAAEDVAHAAEDFESLGGHLHADPVASNDSDARQSDSSMARAMPMPPLTHNAASPRRAPRRSSS